MQIFDLQVIHYHPHILWLYQEIVFVNQFYHYPLYYHCNKDIYVLVYEYLLDFDMMLRIFTAGYVSHYIPEILVSMETGGASNKNSRARLSKTQEDYIVLKKNHVGAGYLTVACKQIRKVRQFLR